MSTTSARIIRDKRKKALKLDQVEMNAEWISYAKEIFPQLTREELMGHLVASAAQSKDEYLEYLLLLPSAANTVLSKPKQSNQRSAVALLDDTDDEAVRIFATRTINIMVSDDDDDDDDIEMNRYESEFTRAMKAAQNDMETDQAQPMTEQEHQAILRYKLKCLSRLNHNGNNNNHNNNNKRHKATPVLDTTTASASSNANQNVPHSAVLPAESQRSLTAPIAAPVAAPVAAPTIECGSLLITLNHEAVIVVYADASTICYVYANDLHNIHDSPRARFNYSWQDGTVGNNAQPNGQNAGRSAMVSMQFSRPFDFIKAHCYGPFSYKFSQFSSLRPVEAIISDSWHLIWKKHTDTIPIFPSAPVVNSTNHEATVEFFLFPTERLVVHRAFNLTYAEQIQLRTVSNNSASQWMKRLCSSLWRFTPERCASLTESDSAATELALARTKLNRMRIMVNGAQPTSASSELNNKTAVLQGIMNTVKVLSKDVAQLYDYPGSAVAELCRMDQQTLIQRCKLQVNSLSDEQIANILYLIHQDQTPSSAAHSFVIPLYTAAGTKVWFDYAKNLLYEADQLNTDHRVSLDCADMGAGKTLFAFAVIQYDIELHQMWDLSHSAKRTLRELGKKNKETTNNNNNQLNQPEPNKANDSTSSTSTITTSSVINNNSPTQNATTAVVRSVQEVSTLTRVVDLPCTLVIVPPTQIGNWKRELAARADPNLKYEIAYKRSQKKISLKQLLHTHVLITSYETFYKQNQFVDPLQYLRWKRVVLDESDELRNSGKRVYAVLREKFLCDRWVFETGTPFRQDIRDLRGLLELPNSNMIHKVERGEYDHRYRSGIDLSFLAAMANMAVYASKNQLLDAQSWRTHTETIEVDFETEEEKKSYETVHKWTQYELEGFRYNDALRHHHALDKLRKVTSYAQIAEEELKRMCEEVALGVVRDRSNTGHPRNSHHNNNNSNNNLPHRADGTVILPLPTQQASTEAKTTADDCCWICLNSFERPVQLPCGHVLDSVCLEGWITVCEQQRKPTFCGLCKRIVKISQIRSVNWNAAAPAVAVGDATAPAVVATEDVIMQTNETSTESAVVSITSTDAATLSLSSGAALDVLSIVPNISSNAVSANTPEDASAAEASAADGLPPSVLLPRGVHFASKVNRLVRLLQARPPGKKTVVCSQYSETLQAVQRALQRKRIPVLSLDCTAASRESVLNRFCDKTTHNILLMSTRLAKGLTLTCADTLYLMEPCLQTQLEEQAMARINRIGQKNPDIYIYYLVMRNTIESSLMALNSTRRIRAAPASASLSLTSNNNESASLDNNTAPTAASTSNTTAAASAAISTDFFSDGLSLTSTDIYNLLAVH